MTPTRPRLNTRDNDILQVLLEAVSELRGENTAAHRGIEANLADLRRELDVVTSHQRAAGLQVAAMEAACRERHKHDTDEVRSLADAKRRLNLLEANGLRRAASRKDIIAALSGLAALLGAAVAAAKYYLGG